MKEELLTKKEFFNHHKKNDEETKKYLNESRRFLVITVLSMGLWATIVIIIQVLIL